MNGSRRCSVCFFAPVRDRSLLATTEFYAQDLEILRGLDLEVRTATRWSEVPWGCDLYFIWWWTWAFLPLVKARLRGRPAIVTGVIDHESYPSRNALQRLLIRGGARAADWNVMTSAMEHRWVRSELGIARSSYIPLGVDTDAHRPGGRPRGDCCFTVCWMKRDNARRKCMPELIASIPLILGALPRMRFLIAGDPQDGSPELQEAARRLGVDHAVQFLGRVDAEEKVRLMQDCQVYLQPTRFEGFGLAIAEALSCGAPVVTSRVGAVPEVVGDCAEFVDGADPCSIADGVIRLVGDPALRAARSRAGRERIEKHFSFERRKEALSAVVRSYLDLPTIGRQTQGVVMQVPGHEAVRAWYDAEYDRLGDGDSMAVKAQYARWYAGLALAPGRKVLDVACGAGDFLEVAARDGHQVAGIDISPVAIEVARRKLPAADLRCGVAESLPFESGAFDVVTCLGSLEHFLDIPRALAEMRRVVAPRGTLLVIVPNRGYLGWRFTTRPGTAQQEIREQLQTLDEWLSMFRAAGLSVASVRADDQPTTWGWIVRSSSPGRMLANAIKAVLLRVLPLEFQYQFIVLLRPDQGEPTRRDDALSAPEIATATR
jgi:glycosyltransferase involved in cell wall biosynthesis/2-polyprenyl-3-methyl-5-hydroxy-6-metoxy-1,4-benzoquinol methylase